VINCNQIDWDPIWGSTDYWRGVYYIPAKKKYKKNKNKKPHPKATLLTRGLQATTVINTTSLFNLVTLYSRVFKAKQEWGNLAIGTNAAKTDDTPDGYMLFLQETPSIQLWAHNLINAFLKTGARRQANGLGHTQLLAAQQLLSTVLIKYKVTICQQHPNLSWATFAAAILLRPRPEEPGCGLAWMEQWQIGIGSDRVTP